MMRIVAPDKMKMGFMLQKIEIMELWLTGYLEYKDLNDMMNSWKRRMRLKN